MAGQRIKLKRFKLDKGHRIVRDEKRFSVSQQLQRKAGGSKKVRVAKRGQA